MSSIGGKKRENTGSGDSVKKVGLFECNVVAINPTIEEYKDKLGIELKEDSKAAEYLGETKDGNSYVRVDVWLQKVNAEDKFKGFIKFRFCRRYKVYLLITWEGHDVFLIKYITRLKRYFLNKWWIK